MKLNIVSDNATYQVDVPFEREDSTPYILELFRRHAIVLYDDFVHRFQAHYDFELEDNAPNQLRLKL